MAVLDSGIDPDHPDFHDRIDFAHSKSFTAWDGIVDADGHGTHIAGIIAGTGVASKGTYVGIAPEAKLVIYKILHKRTGREGNAVGAIDSALVENLQILNYSQGHKPTVGSPPWLWSSEHSIVEEAFCQAAEAGILCVVAAGNEGPSVGSITRPGGLENVLTVGAVSVSGLVCNGSGRGPYYSTSDLRSNQVVRYDQPLHQGASARLKPDLVAPGDCITAPRSRHASSFDPDVQDPDYAMMSGTSQATAVVSGLAACVFSLAKSASIDLGPNPGRTVRRLLIRSARPLKVGTEYDFGAGVLKWPIIQATLQDYANDNHFRRIVLDDEWPRLL